MKTKPTLIDRIMAIVAWVMDLRIVRAFQRFGSVRGNLLAGGIAYSALFAIAGALTIAFTAFSYFLGNNADLQDRLFSAVNEFLPGILKVEGEEGGIIDPQNLIIDNPVNLATIISLLVLLWSSSAMMTAIRLSVQSVFGISRLPRPFPIAKAIDISGFLIIALGAVSSIVIVTATTQFSEAILDWLGIPAGIGSWAIQIGSLLMALAVDSLIFMYIFRVMAGVRAPLADLVLGSVIGGAGSSVLRVLGTSVVSSVSDDPLLAGFGALITLLLWINLLARIVLIAAAITANPPAPGQPTEAQLEHAEEVPNYVTRSRPDTLEWPHDPVSGVITPNPGEHSDDQPVPPWSGLKERRLRANVVKAGEKVEAAEAELYEAKQAYASAAWDAYRSATVPTTSDKLANQDPQKLGEKLAKKEQKRVKTERAKARTAEREKKRKEEKAELKSKKAAAKAEKETM